MTELPQAIFFDLDDTILAFTAPAEPAWVEATEGFTDSYGGVAATVVREAIHRIAGEWWSDAERHRLGRLDLRNTRIRNVADALASLHILDDGLSTRMADTFARLRTEGLRLFPGARQTLEHFHEAGVPMALLTNGDSAGQRHKIERFDLAGFFDCILIEEEFGVGKPEEKVFRHALESLGSTPDTTWMVGDNLHWEIGPCRRLGLHTIWVDFLGNGLPADSAIEPHCTVQSIHELIES
ncbi:MAG: HAD family hydrolase [Candidatus Latescibacteria bacterium]|nr:HAD family hydrolase [Candidatus Latescibacterota bacterium]HJP30962.1 HAD family hydrolase [Candidatus Latescibacterota bacterium]